MRRLLLAAVLGCSCAGELEPANSIDLPGATPIVVPVRPEPEPQYAAADCFSLSTQALNFGRTNVGCISAMRTVTMTNTCDLPIRWSASLASDDFYFVNEPAAFELLAPHSSHALTLRFEPQTVGAHLAVGMVIDTGDAQWVTGLYAESGTETTFEATYLGDGARQDFMLLEWPDQTAPVEVTVDGQPTTAWQYDGVQNAVRFITPPAVDARVTVRADTGC